MIANANPTDFISVSKASCLYGLSGPTLRRMVDDDDSLSYRTVGGHRRISRSRLEHRLGLRDATTNVSGERICLMTRASTPSQKTSLVNQEESCRAYCAEHLPGIPIEVNASIRSGMNVGHESFVDFILKLCSGYYTHVVANHSERICRSSLPLVRALCEKFNVQLHIVNRIDDKDADDFVADILAYTMFYNAKYNSSKSAKLSRIEVTQDDLVTIYRQYLSGYSYSDLSKWCNTNNIRGIKNGKEVSLTAPKLHQLLSRNQKLLQELVTDVDSFTVKFIKSHIVADGGNLIKQVDLYDTYVKWCNDNKYTPVSVKKFGVVLGGEGHKSTKAMGGMKCWHLRWV